MKTLRYAGYQPDVTGFGWATCNTNLRAALGRRFRLVEGDADVDFIPLIDHALTPASDPTARMRFGYTFFEFQLEPDASANAARFDTVFCGSTWCRKRLAEAGIANTAVLMQGVDLSVFRSVPRVQDGQFRIFSGGKCEYRKGHDLVAQAFVGILDEHPDAHLVCAWHNLWPQLIPWRNPSGWAQERLYAEVLQANGIPRSKFTILPQMTARELASQMQQTDLGLFPNRCEGGTNLVAMEYLSCHRPIVANLATGHADLAGAAIQVIPCGLDDMGWASMQVSDIIRAVRIARARSVWPDPPEWSWDDAAQLVADEAERLDFHI